MGIQGKYKLDILDETLTEHNTASPHFTTGFFLGTKIANNIYAEAAYHRTNFKKIWQHAILTNQNGSVVKNNTIPWTDFLTPVDAIIHSAYLKLISFHLLNQNEKLYGLLMGHIELHIVQGTQIVSTEQKTFNHNAP